MDCEGTDASLLACHITDANNLWIDNIKSRLLPGAFLDGKHPIELNVTQLKRWLACHGAPVSGRKQN